VGRDHIHLEISCIRKHGRMFMSAENWAHDEKGTYISSGHAPGCGAGGQDSGIRAPLKSNGTAFNTSGQLIAKHVGAWQAYIGGKQVFNLPDSQAIDPATNQPINPAGPWNIAGHSRSDNNEAVMNTTIQGLSGGGGQHTHNKADEINTSLVETKAAATIHLMNHGATRVPMLNTKVM
jgi:hypothetical protein